MSSKKKNTNTHTKLVEMGAKWLRKHSYNVTIPNCPIIATETSTANSSGEIPDVIGFCYWTSVLIEVKTSRSDYLRDKKKNFRINPQDGMGEYRYYLCPEDLIQPDELPENWGLLYYIDNPKSKVKLITVAKKQTNNLLCERTMLLSLLRRNKIK